MYTAYLLGVGAGWLYCLAFPRYGCVIIARRPPTLAVVFDTLLCYDTVYTILEAHLTRPAS